MADRDRPPEPVTRRDIEGKLEEIKAEVDQTAEQAKPIGLAIGIGAVVLLVVIAYLLGRRKGKKKTTVVEVKRV